MRTQLLSLFAPPLIVAPSARKPPITTLRSPISSPFGGCHHGPIPIRQFRFSRWDNAEYDDDDDEEFEFGFGSSAKRRNWWSDDDWELDEDDDDDEFWGFKVLKAFGWMVPAVAISLVMGTGSNAFLMALAVPLGQTALSLAFDKVWGRTVNRPKPRRRKKSKKKPFARAASNPRRASENEEESSEASRGRGNPRSWSAAADKSASKDNKNVTGFGGWDELDNQVWTDYKIPKRTPSKKTREPLPQKGSKLSKRGRVKDTPLLLRLLVAVFPFLGSWTKLLL